MRQLKDVLHYYTGCHLQLGSGFVILVAVQIEKIPCTDFKIVVLNGNQVYMTDLGDYKPILRPLSSMTEEEAHYFAWLCMDSEYHLEKENRINQDDVQIELVPNDGGNFLDGDILLYIGVSCGCYEGSICFHEDGSIYTADEDGKQERALHDMASKIHWLLSKGFDLFGLIESNQALTKPI